MDPRKQSNANKSIQQINDNVQQDQQQDQSQPLKQHTDIKGEEAEVREEYNLSQPHSQSTQELPQKDLLEKELEEREKIQREKAISEIDTSEQESQLQKVKENHEPVEQEEKEQPENKEDEECEYGQEKEQETEAHEQEEHQQQSLQQHVPNMQPQIPQQQEIVQSRPQTPVSQRSVSRPQTPLSQRSGPILEPPTNFFHFSNSDDAIRNYESPTSRPSTPIMNRVRGPQQIIPDVIPPYFGQYHTRAQAPQQLPQAETSEIVSEIIQDSDPSIAYPESAFGRRCSSSSTIDMASGSSYASSLTATAPGSTIVGSRRTSSSVGSVYKHKDHVRKTSFVAGWDSDDDEEMDQARQNPETIVVNEKSPWLRSEAKKRKKVSTCICLGVVVCFLVCGSILALVYKEEIFSTIHGGHKDGQGHGNDNSGTSSKVQSIEAKYHVNSTINPNPALSNVFYGIDYTPAGSQEPYCGLNQGAVIEDIKVISQLTNRIRIYGMACHQAESVLKAIEYLGLPDMQIALTLWVDSNSTSWEAQKRTFWNLIDNDVKLDTSSISDLTPQSKTGKDFTLSKSISRINGISVGNEVLFRNEDMSKLDQHVPVSTLTDYINQIRDGLALRAKEASSSSDAKVVALGKNLTNIPIFSSDLGRNAYQIEDSVDEVMSNIHPFFAQTQVQDAADWAANNYKSETVSAAGDKPAGISEVGWPSGPSSAKIGAAVPSMDNLQQFVNDWVCLAMKKKIPYYFFEAFDEPWKSSINPREAQWGIMTSERKMKITLPKC
ncbi:hypothetical protein BGZ76_009432 [Entomortierella beljakovae]|nr:hypothetical protein BGZ76_009432 [Entomortierella beljakovae]